METITTTGQPPRPTGTRIITKTHKMAEMLGRLFDPDPDFDRFEAVRILKRIGTRLPDRWSPMLIAHIELLVSFTQDRDWHDGRPVVWLSVEKTAQLLGISPSQVNYNERQMLRLVAITFHDSGNHKRHGHRCPDTGRILEAHGVDL